MKRPTTISRAAILLGAAALAGAGDKAVAEPADLAQPAVLLLRERVEACTGAARERDPQLQAHGLGHFVARGDRVVGVTIVLPEAPELVACLEDLPLRGTRVPMPAAPGSAAGIGFGGFAVDVGGPRPQLPPAELATTVANGRAQLRALVRKLVTRGVLSADDPAVRELLAPELAPSRR